MSSFLFQKEQINCNCFDNSPKANRRVFRSQSYHSTSNNNKEIKEISVRNQSQEGKHKKKSLKKQKHPYQIGSQKDPKQKQQILSNYFIPQLPINPSSNQYRKQQKVINFQNIDGEKLLNIKPQKNKTSHYLRNNRPVEPFINDLSIMNPLITNINNSINLSGKSYPQSLQYINYKATPKYENIPSHREFQQMINKEFEQDLHQFKIQMQRKSKIQQKDKFTFNKKVSLDKLINFQARDQEQQTKNDKKSLQISIKEKQKNQSRIKFKTRKQSLSANKNQNQKYQNYSLQNQEFTHRISAAQYQRTPIRPASFRGSTVSQKQKQSITKKIKGRMLPKQIQSEKDGSSSQSDQLSQVLGRGWDGLTQQRIQLQQLQQMTKRQKLNSQTMVTQQSRIKNSQIKTQTGYSNSFISPKSQNTKAFPFGVHKYGVTGLSYHHIQQFSNHKQTYHQKNIF